MPKEERAKFVTVDSWVEERRKLDGAEGLWRIHNDLYDLTDFVKRHPGGSIWLELTKGMDITEAFESYHISMYPEKLLPKFRVRSACTPRASPYTFQPNGFYKTLKGKVRQHFGFKNPDPSSVSVAILDFYFASMFAACALSATHSSFVFATLAGILMALVVNCGHNLLHMRDGWRANYFYFTTFSAREWRVTHCLSHHLFTNTDKDLEISLFEPFLQWFPKKKNAILKYASWIYGPLFCGFITILQIFKRIYTKSFTGRDYLLFAPFVVTLIFAEGNVKIALPLWIWAVIVCGFTFGFIGFTAAHHHPDIYHHGDEMRNDTDWGLHQMDAVKDRKELIGNYVLGLILFGEHSLHHLFPSLDFARLRELIPAFEETCREFGLESYTMPYGELIGGTFRQLLRSTPNKKPRGEACRGK